MADSVEEALFWLPSEFFDDFLTDNTKKTDSDPHLSFPTEFPYDFETDNNNQALEKRYVMSTSPQSTLPHTWSFSGRSAGDSSNGSPNSVTSPPTTPLGARNDAVGDLIHRAAGEVARLKVNGGDGFPGPPRSLAQIHPVDKIPNPSVLQNIHFQQQMVKHQNQGCEIWYNQQQMYQNRARRAVGETGQDLWPIQQNPTRIFGSDRRAVMLGGSGGGGGAAAKRGCAGTGVFLPRRYGNNNNGSSNAYSSDPRKKPAGYSAALAPNSYGHALNKNLATMNGFAQSQPQYQQKFERGFVSDYDFLMARRNALMLQNHQQHQNRSSLLEGSSLMSRRGTYLPQEWTY